MDVCRRSSTLQTIIIALNAFMLLYLLSCCMWMWSLKEGEDIRCELDDTRVYNYSNLSEHAECEDVVKDHTYNIPGFLSLFALVHGVILILVYITIRCEIPKTHANNLALTFFRFAVWGTMAFVYLGLSFYVYNKVLSFGHEDSMYLVAIPSTAPSNVTHGIDSTAEGICLLIYPSNLKNYLSFGLVASMCLVLAYISQAFKILLECPRKLISKYHPISNGHLKEQTQLINLQGFN